MLTCARCPKDVPDPRALVDHLTTEQLLDPKRAEAEALVRVFKPGDRVRLNEQGRRLASSHRATARLGAVDRIGRHTGAAHVRWDGLKTTQEWAPSCLTHADDLGDPDPTSAEERSQENMMTEIARGEVDQVDQASDSLRSCRCPTRNFAQPGGSSRG